MIILTALLLVILPFSQKAEKGVVLGNMSMAYQIIGDEIEIQLQAPTKGWLGIGFNNTNSIVKSDLYLLRVRNGNIEGIDMDVIAAGNPKKDEAIGGSNNLKLISGKENENGTKVIFRLPIKSRDSHDFVHSLGDEFWLILAYSQSDDYGHHSTMRKHTKFKFSK